MNEGSYEEGFEPKKGEDKKESTEIKNEENPYVSEDFSEESLPSDYADALKKDKKEGEEELKELSSDYKADYDKYLKEKDNPKEEDDDNKELIIDYRSGLDLSNKETAPQAPKREVVTEEEPIEIEKKEEVNPKQEIDKEEKTESKEEGVEEKPTEQGEKSSPEQGKESPEVPEKKEETKDNSVEIGEIGMLASELMDLSQLKNKLLSQKDEQKGLMYKLGIKKKDSKIDEEYRIVFDKYNEVLKKLEGLTGKSPEEIESEHIDKKEGGEKQEESPEDEKKVKEVRDILSEKTKEVHEQIKNLEAGKRGSFEKIKALMKDRKFQFLVGLAIVGIAIAAPPTGFISMITFGMHAGLLPAAYATKATAMIGMAGGAFIMRGISSFAEGQKKQGKKEVNLTKEIK